jgi:hypothetical protein
MMSETSSGVGNASNTAAAMGLVLVPTVDDGVGMACS